MPDGFEVSSKKVKWLTFHLLISHKIFSISFSLLVNSLDLSSLFYLAGPKSHPSCIYAIKEVHN